MEHGDLQVTEVEPGELAVLFDGRTIRILVPAGIGVPGVGDAELAAAVLAELVDRDAPLDDVIDVSSVLRSEPGLLHDVARRVDPDA